VSRGEQKIICARCYLLQIYIKTMEHFFSSLSAIQQNALSVHSLSMLTYLSAISYLSLCSCEGGNGRERERKSSKGSGDERTHEMHLMSLRFELLFYVVCKR
jgi:hypothetical protein